MKNTATVQKFGVSKEIKIFIYEGCNNLFKSMEAHFRHQIKKAIFSHKISQSYFSFSQLRA